MGRTLYTALGVVFTLLGFIGAFVPLMPTTIFLILAVCCFKRGSERLERWLLDHPRFGSTLRDWEERGGIRLSVKRAAIALLWVALALSMLAMQKPTTKVIVAAVGLWVTWYIWTRPTLPERGSDDASLCPDHSGRG
jgi:uncharacterized membrane protein YbaN (DUF454 family)